MKKRLLLFQNFAIICAFSVHGQNFVDVTKSNSGQTINLTTNQVLEVKLPCNPSSGYGWYATSVDAGKVAIIQQIGN
jgi:predicted secreted protein